MNTEAIDFVDNFCLPGNILELEYSSEDILKIFNNILLACKLIKSVYPEYWGINLSSDRTVDISIKDITIMTAWNGDRMFFYFKDYDIGEMQKDGSGHPIFIDGSFPFLRNLGLFLCDYLIKFSEDIRAEKGRGLLAKVDELTCR